MPCPKPAISFICITVLLDVFCVGLVAPVFPKLVELLQEGDVQATAQSIGWLGALYSVMQFVFSPIVGSLSDRFGRRPVLVISLLGASADYLVLAWTPALTWLCLSRAIAGMTAATYLTATAYVADVTSLEKRAAGFGKLGAAVGLGLILGPAVGGLLLLPGGQLARADQPGQGGGAGRLDLFAPAGEGETTAMLGTRRR